MSHGWNERRPAGRVAYVDGRYVRHGDAGVHIEDRGLQLGDSVYEVCLVSSGHLMDESEHLDRLERSLREIEVAMPMPRGPLALVMREVVRRNGVCDGLLYLQVTRGAVRRDHPIPSSQPRPTLMLTARGMDVDGLTRRKEQGIAAITRPDERWARRDIKTTQLLANLLAKTEARKAGAYEALLVDDDGFITEGSSMNAWIVDGEGRLVTRSLTHEILPGVTRRVILDAAAEGQLPVVERSFTPEDVLTAREAFVSAATGVLPVITLNGRKIGDGKAGPVTRRVQELYGRLAEKRALDRA
ncbi:MAG TPA: D-amino-acid transaminase [Rhizomicrobium sp.]|nr:D-amino-acid transaminase [Rhizomicrobium sp.]